MDIQQQKQLADTILPILTERWDAVLAGGAPRDWYFGNTAKDLDFFVIGEPSQEELQAAFPDAELTPATDKKYEGTNFTTYNLSGQGMDVQVMSYRAESIQDVIENFPCSLSMSWYDGESHYHPHFLISAEYNILTFYGQPGSYVERVMSKFLNFNTFCFGIEDTLKTIGGMSGFGFSCNRRPAWGIIIDEGEAIDF